MPRRRLDIRTRRYRGTLYVATPDNAYELDVLAAFLVRHADGVRTVAQLGDALAAEFRLDAPTARRNAEEMCRELAEHGVLEFVPRGPAARTGTPSWGALRASG